METLEKLQNVLPSQFLIQLPKVINFEPFKNLDKKIEDLRYFSKISFKIIKEVKNSIKPGVTEKQIEQKIKKFGKKCNVTVVPLLVSSGENTAKVHGYSTERKIQERDIIMIDIGIKRHLFSNCTSDITRTFFIGEPTKFQRKIYDMVKKAHDKAIEVLRPGINAFVVDKMVRDFFKESNYEMPHGLGHGTGTRYPHNPPMLSNKFKVFVLKKADIVTIEPGIYLQGKFGVRIEDMILITETGNEIISKE